MVRIASPTFVGRSAELAALDEALNKAGEGVPTTVLLGGDAGVGKTRLLETWNRRAVEHAARVVSGACLDLGESGPAYVAVVQAVRDLLGPLEPSALDRLVGTERRTLARVIPELASEDGDGLGEHYNLIAQTRLFSSFIRLLERASSETTLVLELEDIHWADPSTRMFIPYLVASSNTGKLLIVATFRADEVGRDHPLTAILRQLQRHPRATRIDLSPFSATELHEQLLGILGRPPTSGLLDAIHGRSEGNALFAEELVASGNAAGELPYSIGRALLSRTAALSPEARTALRVASVIGRSAPFELLRSGCDLPDAELVDALREAVMANILEPDHAAEGYRFRHALLQEAIYEDTLPGERRNLHAAVATALESGYQGPLLEQSSVSQLAHHWFEARDVDRAMGASVVAGDAAIRQLAYAEALRHFERALDLWDTSAPAGREQLSLTDLLRRASRSAWQAGEPAKTIEYNQRVLDNLDNNDDPCDRVRALDAIARALHVMAREDEAIEYDLKLELVEPEGLPVPERAMRLDALVRALRWKGDRVGARSAAGEALSLAESTKDPILTGPAHVTMAWVLYEIRDFDGALREARLAQEGATLAGDDDTLFEANSVVYEVYAEAGELELAIDSARTARAHLDRVGLSRAAGGWAAFVEAQSLFFLGNLEESMSVLDTALIDPPADRSLLVLNLLAAQVCTATGSYEASARHLEAARLPDATVVQEDGRGFLATARAGLAAAESRLGDVRAIVDATGPRIAGLESFSDMSETIWGLVEVGVGAEATMAEIARAGRDDAALAMTRLRSATMTAYVDEVRRQRTADGVPDTGRHRGHEALIAGHLARIEGRDEAGLWAAAASEFPPRSVDALSARYRQVEAMLAARSPRDEVRSAMADAHAAAVETGARPLAAQFEALARRARIDLRPATSAAPGDDVAVVAPDEPEPPGTAALRGRGLSDREIEVLTLVAAGFSNSEIGRRLFISPKTASVHVTHILDKLDVAGRTEAAIIGVRLGLPDMERDDVGR